MDFLVQFDHDEHNVSWTVYSTLHRCPVCLACIVEITENQELLPLQKQPALTELLRLLSQQSGEIMPLFMQEERIVWHLIKVLLGCLEKEEDSFLSLVIEVLLKLVQVVGSDDLVTAIVDHIVEQVQEVSDHKKLLPHYTLLGKMLYQLPPLSKILVSQYDILLYDLSLDLSNVGEAAQSAIAYIFIFLCDAGRDTKLAVRTLEQVHVGILSMLSTAQSLPVQINGLGLLKKLVQDDDSCKRLMLTSSRGVTLLTCMKKLLLGKKDILHTGVSQILSLILRKDNFVIYASSVLESDIVEFLFESLHTENTIQIECILKVLQKLSNVDEFYKRCHSVYGVESVLRALSTALEIKNPTLLKHGYALLTEILNRHPEDIPLFLSNSVVRKCLGVILQGLGNHQLPVYIAAEDTFSAMLRRKYLLSPVAFRELGDMISMVTRRKADQLKPLFKLGDAGVGQKAEKLLSCLDKLLEVMIKSCTLVIQCREDLTSCESNFAAPGSQDSHSSVDTFIQAIVDAGQFVESVVTLDMRQWTEKPDVYTRVLEVFLLLNNVDSNTTSDIVCQLVRSHFIKDVVDIKVRFETAQLASLSERFLRLVVECCQKQDMITIIDNTETILSASHFRWTFSSMCQTFREERIEVDSVQSYLLLVFLSYKYGQQMFEGSGLEELLISILHQHSVEQLPPLARKCCIYFLAYSSVYDGADITDAVPCESLSAALEGSLSEWYTHDICLLQWSFNHPVLAGTSGHRVLEAFLTNISMETMEQIFGTEELAETDILLRLCEGQTFLHCLVTCLATSDADVVAKISFLLENVITRSVKQEICPGTSQSQIEENSYRECSNNSVDQEYMFTKVSEVLHSVFLKNYPQATKQNIVGLLHVMLFIMKTGKLHCEISIKILYHVLSILSRTEPDSGDLEIACMLTLLAAVTDSQQSHSQNSVCAIVVQHEGFMEFFQECMVGVRQDELYCIASDLLSSLVKHTNLKCNSPCKLEIVKLVTQVIQGAGDVQVVGVNLLTALLSTGLQSPVVEVSGKISAGLFRRLYISLQQLCLQEGSGVAYSAAECMRSIIQHLTATDPQLGDELLHHPWNQMLLDVILDLASEGTVMDHHLSLLCLFTDLEGGHDMLRASGLAEKLLKIVPTFKITDTSMTKIQEMLLKKLKTCFKSSLPDSRINKEDDHV